MDLYSKIKVGERYQFDLTVSTPRFDHHEMVAGVVLEKTTIGETRFLILDQQRAINMDYVTRVIGRF